jgi:oxygen-independent coproporphyrinogen-3 oxidase
MLPLPDPDLAADMYEWLSATLEAHNYIQYEISNWAKGDDEGRMMNDECKPANSSFACRHNLQYWRGLPYLAFGAGAHGYANGYRYSNVLRIKSYIERLTNYESRSTSIPFPLSPATVNQHKQTIDNDMSEYMMTGLRLTQDGVSEDEFQTRFDKSMHDVYGKEIDELLKLGLMEKFAGTGGCPSVRISKRGRLLGNQVFMRFV